MNKRALYEANMNLQLEDLKKSVSIALDELDKSHAARAMLHDELIIAEGQRDQAKMRADAAKRDNVLLKEIARCESQYTIAVTAERDALLTVYEAATAWVEVSDPPRTDNYREYRQVSDNLINVINAFHAPCNKRDNWAEFLTKYDTYNNSIVPLRKDVIERDALLALLTVYEAAEDFIGAQGTAYEDDQYRMLCGVVGAYNQQRGIHES